MAGKIGKTAVVGWSPNSAGTWRTPETIGPLDGIYPSSIDEIQLQGDPQFDESIGIAQLQYSDRTADEATPTIVLPMRWNGVQWSMIYQLIGSDVKSGIDPYTHTGTYLEEPVAVHATMAIGIDTDNDAAAEDIIEWPSVKPTAFTLEPDGENFWQLTVNTMANTIKYGGDANADATAIGNVTYHADMATSRMRYRGLSLKTNTQGSDPSAQTAKNVAEVTFSLTRPFEASQLIEAVTTGAEKQIPEPVQRGHPEIRFSWNEIDEYADIADFDDLEDETALTGDFEMAETISTQALSLRLEMPNMVRFPAQTAIENGSRIPCTKNYACAAAASTPTGQDTANRVHLVVINGDNVDYDTNAP
jgi:hypothetical protein